MTFFYWLVAGTKVIFRIDFLIKKLLDTEKVLITVKKQIFFQKNLFNSDNIYIYICTMNIKKSIFVILLVVTIGLITQSNTTACDVRTDAQITTGSFNYYCISGSPALLTKTKSSGYAGHGEIDLTVTQVPGAGATPSNYFHNVMKYGSANIDCGSNSNCCISIEIPSQIPFKIFEVYLLYGSSISCAAGQPNVCHAWSNTNYNSVYSIGTLTNCSTNIPINNYINTKTCNF